MAKAAEKVTVVLEPDARDAVARWAAQEGRPVSNLVRRIVSQALERRTAEQQQVAA
jgi:hypothetical protein